MRVASRAHFGQTQSIEHDASTSRTEPPWLGSQRARLELPPSGRNFEDSVDASIEFLPVHEPENAFGRGRLTWPTLTPWHIDPDQTRETSSSPIVEEVTRSGFDVLAWYVSYRSFSDRWGIFIREDAAVGVGQFFADRHRQLDLVEGIDATVRLLMAHEYFHFLVDIGSEVIEDVLGAPLYGPWRHDNLQRSPVYNPLEEALANAFAYRRGKTRGLARPTRAFLEFSPVGYRDFGSYISDDTWYEGLRTLLTTIEMCGVETTGDPGPWGRELFIDEQQRLVSPLNVPVWLVRSIDQPESLSLITTLGPVASTERYQRDMARLPTGVRLQLEKAVESAQTGVTPKKLKRLTGHKDLYRLRSGDYRAILRRMPDGGFHAIRAGHRRKIYRGLQS